MNNPSNNWAIIVVALIGLAGVIVTAVLSRESGERAAIEIAIAATMTAEAKDITPTAIKNTESPSADTLTPELPTPTYTLPLPTVENTKSAEATSELIGLANVKMNTETPTQIPEPPTFTSTSTPIPTATLPPTLTPTTKPPATQTPRPTATAAPTAAKSAALVDVASTFSLGRYFPFNSGSYWVYQGRRSDGKTFTVKDTVKLIMSSDGIVQSIVFRDVSNILVDSTTSYLYIWNDDSIELLSVSKGMNTESYAPFRILAKEPMEPGQIWSWKGSINDTTAIDMTMVDDWASVTVPAGTFRALLIRDTMTVQDPSNPLIITHMWLATGVGIVKMDISDNSTTSYELVDYEITR